MLGEILRRRHVRSVVWFHSDHWEPWAWEPDGGDDAALRRVDSFNRQVRGSPAARKMTLFYLTDAWYCARTGAPSSAALATIELLPRGAAEDRRVRTVLGDLRTQTDVEFQVHIHHEHVVGSDGEWSDLHRQVKVHADPGQDRRNLDYMLRSELARARADTGLALEKWAFVHGLWALNGSDRTVCQVDDEIEVLMRHGCYGDFTFPAGRPHCDPTMMQRPYTCRPLLAAKAYDDPRCEPIAIAPAAGAIRDDRFLIWNSEAKHDVCSLDYYSDRTFDLVRDADGIVASWLAGCPVIDHVLYIKTHAHSMDPFYYEEGNGIPLGSKRIEAIASRLRQACDDARIELGYATVGEVFDTLCAVDRGPAEPAASLAVPLSPQRAAGNGQRADASADGLAGVDELNSFAIDTLDVWLANAAGRRNSAGAYYLQRLAQGRFFVEAEQAIAHYTRDTFDQQACFFELGSGFGELSILLALSGFRSTGFECDIGRHAGSTILKQALQGRGLNLDGLALVQGYYPDALDVSSLNVRGETIIVSSNVTSTHLMENFDYVLRSLRLFDHVILDLSRFGEARTPASQADLCRRLRELGFREVAQVFAMGDTDIRHFAQAPQSFDPFQTFSDSFTIGGNVSVDACPVCQSRKTAPLWHLPQAWLDTATQLHAPGAKHHGTSVGSLPLLRVPQEIYKFDICADCHSIFGNPRQDDHLHYATDASQVEAFRDAGTDAYRDTAAFYEARFPQDASLVVEAACGSGQILALLRHRRPELQLLGLELSSPSVEWIKSLGIDARVADLDFDDLDRHVRPGSAGVVILNEAFEHVRRPLVVLQKLVRMLRPGGRLCFSAQFYGPDASLPIRANEPIYIDRSGLDWITQRLDTVTIEVIVDTKFRVTLERRRSSLS